MKLKKHWFKFVVVAVATAWPQNATVPGVPISPHPTLIHLAVEWPIQGDDNLNGVVAVRYRQTGVLSWKQGMPLRRVPAGSNVGFSWGNKHSGSLFDLTPDTPYEIELTLTDPDGGSAVQTITARTRAMPVPMAGAPVKSATPSNFTSVVSGAQPGDILLLSDGNYGTFYAGRDGQAGKLIVFRSQNPGRAVFTEFDLKNRKYLSLDGLTINGFVPWGSVRLGGSLGCVVQRCSVDVPSLPGSGITAYEPAGARDAYIADNTVTRYVAFVDSAFGTSGNEGEGVQVTGPGNVICYNRVQGFRDNISFLEDAQADSQVCNDVYNNDVLTATDDAIEADFAMGNCRILRNRITNAFDGLSSQPSLGGPTYFIRNVMYNAFWTPFKFYRGGIGDVAFHNTAVKCGDALQLESSDIFARAFFRNNLFIGGKGDGIYGTSDTRLGRIMVASYADATCSFDYDGFGSIGTGTFSGNIGSAYFSSLAQMKSNTTEKHAVEADLSVFAQSIIFPTSPIPEKAVPDLRPKSGTVIIDAGVVLANINDGFVGTAPDLGAYEAGEALPVYGPRPVGGTAVERVPPRHLPGGAEIAVQIYDVRGRMIKRIAGDNIDIKSMLKGFPAGVYVYTSLVRDAGGEIRRAGGGKRVVW